MRTLLFLLCLISLSSHSASTELYLNGQKSALPPGDLALSTLLISLDKQSGPWWWPGAFLSSKDERTRFDRARKNWRLALTATATTPQVRQWQQALLPLLDRLKIGGRLKRPLDPDQIWLWPETDEVLDTAADYRLHLSHAPKYVAIWNGEKICRLPHLATADSRDYLVGCPTALPRNLDDVLVITPDGQAQKRGIAYWNRNRKPLADGTLIAVLPPKSTAEKIFPNFVTHFGELLVAVEPRW